MHERYIAEWETANEGWTVTPEVVGWAQCQDKATTLAAAGSPVGMAYVGSRTLKEFALNELIVPVPMTEEEQASYYPNIVDTVTFEGTGTRRIMLIAHMDTVYQRGMLAGQPFRVDGDKAYGLGIADDKQGIAVILHALAMLRQLDFREYGTLTVLINGDEEISSPGSRALITQLGAEHDAVLSHEGASITEDKLSLATAGIGAVALTVRGKASHAGSAPERGVNAFYEMAHQVLQMRDLSDPATGLKMNWTTAQAGTNRNVIPALATANADVRVTRVADYDRVEKAITERVRTQLVPEAQVEARFERRRPPLESSPASLALARHAQGIYGELGRKLGADDKVAGGGTDAAFAGLSTRAGVVERFGLQGYGAHSADAEYVLLDSIEPRLYLVTRMIIDIARGKAGL